MIHQKYRAVVEDVAELIELLQVVVERIDVGLEQQGQVHEHEQEEQLKGAVEFENLYPSWVLSYLLLSPEASSFAFDL